MLPELAAGAIFFFLVLYVLTAGADFGGGIWSFVARYREEYITAQEAEHAIAPIWEANHIWMIIAIVCLFVCFPHAFALIATVLHIPLVLVLLGIVVRGSAYVFGAYGLGSDPETKRWQQVFGTASLLTPIFLGVSVGALATGEVVLPSASNSFAAVYVSPWLGLFPVVCGVFALTMFSHLAAVYLTVDAKTESAREMFRLYAIFSGIALGLAAFASAFAIPDTEAGSAILQGLFGGGWSVLLQGLTATAALVVLHSLFQWKFRRARIAVVLQTILIMLGWGASQYPYLVPGHFTIHDAAAENIVISWTLGVLVAGAFFLFPAFIYLFRVYKFQSSNH